MLLRASGTRPATTGVERRPFVKQRPERQRRPHCSEQSAFIYSAVSYTHLDVYKRQLEYLLYTREGKSTSRYGKDFGRHLKKSRRVIFIYRVIYCGCAYLGAVASLKAVWNFSDIMNGFMAVPNLVCILIMSREACHLLLSWNYGKMSA